MEENYYESSEEHFSVGNFPEKYNTSSLWISGKYQDEILFETDNFMVVKFKGQNYHKNDKYICNGSYVFMKIRSIYVFKGNVVSWKLCEKNEIGTPNEYELVIQKYYSNGEQFERKNDAIMHFGLSGGDIIQGIIPHSKGNPGFL